MNIMLVRPMPHKDSIGLRSFMICEPLELEYICSYLEKYEHNVVIIDMMLEKKSIKYFINKYKPHVVGFTAYITHVGVVKEYAKEVKEANRNCVTVVGGVHAEVVPEDFEDENVDYILKVNGLKTFKEIVDNLSKPVEINKEQIKGVWKDNKKEYIIETDFKYPHPNRESTRKYRVKYNYIYHSKCATLKTSFGCPYKCEFCFCVKITQNEYFERDMEDVIEEIKKIEEKNIFIVDDNFLLRRERVQAFCKLLIENNIKKNYILFGRADFIADNEELIEQLSKLGLQAVFVGIESFKDNELDNYDKKTSVEMNIKAIHTLEKYGVQCFSGIIVGLDWEKRDFDNLAKWLDSFKFPTAVNIQPITPMPGTSIYEARNSDLIIPREKYELWDMTHLVLQPTKMSISSYYYNLVCTYYKTSAGFRASIYILKKYGLATYIRVLIGGLNITWQYIKLIIANKGK